MTQSSQDTFVDRRTDEQRDEGLATQILFWYDQDKKKRRRINGMAVTTEGHLVVARATCSKKDQFVKVHGRMIVAKRLFGRAKNHCSVLVIPGADGVMSNDKMAEMAARAYEEMFPKDDKGHKRAYNAGKIFTNYRAEINRRANELLDGFDDGQSAD